MKQNIFIHNGVIKECDAGLTSEEQYVKPESKELDDLIFFIIQL